MRDLDVHAFLRQLHAEGVAVVSPREHLLVSRMLEVSRGHEELADALAAVLARTEAEAIAVRGAWRRWTPSQRLQVRVQPAVQPTGDVGLPPTPLPEPEDEEVPERVSGRDWLLRGLGVVALLVIVTLGALELQEEPSRVIEPPRVDADAPTEVAIQPDEPEGCTLVLDQATKVETKEVALATHTSPVTGGVLTALGMLLAMLGAVLILLAQHARDAIAAREAAVKAEREKLQAGDYAMPLLHRVEPLRPFPDAVLDAVGRELARIAHALDGEAWDVPRTVDASARGGGLVQPRYLPRRQPLPLVALVDLEQGDHVFLHVYEAVLDAWERLGVPVEAWSFQGQPDSLTSPHGDRTTLDELVRRRADAVVLVFTRLRNPYGYDDRISWVQRLKPWQGRAVLLDPDPRPYHRPDDGIPRWPLTREGLFASARWLLEGGEPKTLRSDWTPPSSLDADQRSALDRWAAIASLVPHPRWAHLDDLRRAFVPEREDWRDAVLLLEHVGQGANDVGPGIDTRACQPTLEALREQPPWRPLEREVHERLRTQLSARMDQLAQQGHAYASTIAELKVGLHEVALGRMRLEELVEDWIGRGVAPELEQLLEEETVLRLRPADAAARKSLRERLAGTHAGLPELWSAPRRLAVAGGVMAGLLVGAVAWASWESGEATVELPVTTPQSWKLVCPGDEPVVGATPAASALVDVAEMRFMAVPAGVFTMGSPEGVGDDDERPAHRVRMEAFDIGVTEVTQAQWTAVMGSNPSDCDYGCGDELPVQSISWLDAVDFLNRLSVREELEPCYERGGDDVSWPKLLACEGYRLPTEAEWEYAARAGSATTWSFGDDQEQLSKYAWFRYNSGNEVHAVASKTANPWGLHDVHGNVYEWVWDIFVDTAYNRGTPADMPVAPGDAIVTSADSARHVLRGGTFRTVASWTRSADRDGVGPGLRLGGFGLRCVRGPLQLSTFDP